ncbi:MAG TPA: stage V sporulation protein AD [Bacillota bacterium]|nr:stage V sporulation protein AD [Bacillota bacterium]
MAGTKKLGKQTFAFTAPPVILASGTMVGPMEGEGPLGEYFHMVASDGLLGEQSWEKAEMALLKSAFTIALDNAGLQPTDIDLMLAGDLLNQIISANYTARDMAIPFLGLYGACSTMAESMALGAILVDGGFANRVLQGASSHYNTAERQYRGPAEYGSQRALTAQWTVTGAGASVICAPELVAQSGITTPLPRITHATVGKVVDLGVKDAADMGSAMAPAVADTLVTHFQDTGRNPDYYDLIVTGDLANVGSAMLTTLTRQATYDLGNRHVDCGSLIYDPSQDAHSGGSGCGCSASVVGSYILQEMANGKFKKVLFVGSGALMSPIASQQGESIPGIGHAVVLEI